MFGIDERERRELAEHVRRIRDDVIRSLRRPRPAEIHSELDRCGITVLNGVQRFTDNAGATPYRPGEWMRSTTEVVGPAYLLPQHDDASLAWETAPAPDTVGRWVALVFTLSMGNGSSTPQPTGHFDVTVNGRLAVSFTLTSSDRQWTGACATLGFRVLASKTTSWGEGFAVDRLVPTESMFADGYAVVIVPGALVSPGEPLLVDLRGTGDKSSRQWCRVSIGEPALFADDHLDALAWTLAPPVRCGAGGYELLIGDLHNHSGQSLLIDDLPPGQGADAGCGDGDRETLFRYARDVAGLDFFCLSEHDWQMAAADWKHLIELNDEFHSERFITIHGYEWTSMAYGHRNVYFRDRPGPLLHSSDVTLPLGAIVDDAPTPRQLWSALRDSGVPALTVPHHMSAALFPLNLDNFHDPEFDRVAEIYSTWGDSLEHNQAVSTGAARIPELAFIESIRRGRQVGFIGSSDSHDGHPGNAQGTARRAHLFHFLGSGFAGVYVEHRDRDAIFDALRARRCIATTTPNLMVWTQLEESPMGSVIARSALPARPQLHVEASSAAPLSSLLVYQNGAVIERIDLAGRRQSELSLPIDTSTGPGSVFVKTVRSDGEMAWSSPIWWSDSPQRSAS